MLTIHAVYGSVAKLIDPNNRPANIHPEHTHTWSVYVKGVNDADISYWLKKVQFKLHETYANSTRMIEGPPFVVEETGWGEFEVTMKLYFVPEANEKPGTLWHQLKLHHYGENAEAAKERREPVVSQSYEEIMFNEPTEAFFDIMTTGPPIPQAGRGKGAKGSKQAALKGKGERTAEIPYEVSRENAFSSKTEAAEMDRLREAGKTVDMMIKEERDKLTKLEKEVEALRIEAAARGV